MLKSDGAIPRPVWQPPGSPQLWVKAEWRDAGMELEMMLLSVTPAFKILSLGVD